MYKSKKYYAEWKKPDKKEWYCKFPLIWHSKTDKNLSQLIKSKSVVAWGAGIKEGSTDSKEFKGTFWHYENALYLD